jgi:hypothetical protein
MHRQDTVCSDPENDAQCNSVWISTGALTVESTFKPSCMMMNAVLSSSPLFSLPLFFPWYQMTYLFTPQAELDDLDHVD